MIRTITINGFKSIDALTLPLGTVNCFIGANGVGKSNILEAIGVLGAAANGKVDDEALKHRGVRPGVPRLYKTSSAVKRTPAQIGLGAKGGDGEEYRVSLLNPLESPEPAWSFKTEFLSDGAQDVVSNGPRNNKNLSPTSGLAALKVVDIAPDNAAARLMRSLADYAIYSPNTPTLRGMVQDAGSRMPVGLSGGLLADGFSDLKRLLSKSGDADALDDLRELIDWVADIDVTSQGNSLLSPSIPRTKSMLKFTDRFMQKSRNELTAYDASEGALYVIFSALLCLSPHSPQVFAVDNLDQALNPRLVAKLVEKICGWMRQPGGALPRQLLFTAHNPAVLDGLDLENDAIRLFAVERNSDGFTRIRRIELTPALAGMQAEYPLSRLWMMGHLGAVPNV